VLSYMLESLNMVPNSAVVVKVFLPVWCCIAAEHKCLVLYIVLGV
jgi:hypothetical protein